MMDEQETREFQRIERAAMIARIRQLEKKVDEYEWIMLLLFILAISHWFF